jgi:hypothetical protein
MSASTDGWQDLKDNRKLDWHSARAEDGNLEIDISKRPEFTLGLAFGESAHAAIAMLFQYLSGPFDPQA